MEELAGILAAWGVVGAVALGPPADAADQQEREMGKPIVFVCQHGNVKSLIASEWFNRLAAERGLQVRATARGLTPEAEVAPPIADRLRTDGFDFQGVRPLALTPADLAAASRVVLIGAEPPSWMKGSPVPVDHWDGIPPASERYEASRDALRARIRALIDSLAASAAGR